MFNVTIDPPHTQLQRWYNELPLSTRVLWMWGRGAYVQRVFVHLYSTSLLIALSADKITWSYQHKLYPVLSLSGPPPQTFPACLTSPPIHPLCFHVDLSVLFLYQVIYRYSPSLGSARINTVVHQLSACPAHLLLCVSRLLKFCPSPAHMHSRFERVCVLNHETFAGFCFNSYIILRYVFLIKKNTPLC